ncbi:hypothetical protein MLD38_038562 [Melastoma candidum]|uniref:Uncharacterized protein n=1 Tax=Melastoma candidum TaxID=119954 RepID=A0ACB9L1L3_9MYRT|nr:hypothetical protein MLD38_038562 [Melastoma candidum]
MEDRDEEEFRWSLKDNMDLPPDFMCPISREVMEEPVTISTGVSYDRKSIETWLFTYRKNTCPATMQVLDNLDVTPNHTLARLIRAWKTAPAPRSEEGMCNEVASLLESIGSSPFKVSSLKKLRSVVECDGGVELELVGSSGVKVLAGILVQILVENLDFAGFRACEEAVAVLYLLSPSIEDRKEMKILFEPESVKSLATLLQRGSTEARVHSVGILRKIAKCKGNLECIVQEQDVDLFKSLLEIVSDEICKKEISSALELLIEILAVSKKSRLRAIESGAVCILVELLPDSARSKAEKILLLLKLLCECKEGRTAMLEHGISIAAVTKNLSNVSATATKLGVKILWLICTYHPSKRVMEEMVACGAVKKLVELLHMDGRSSTKEKVVRMMKSYGQTWTRLPCFPDALKNYLGMMSINGP